MSFSFGGAGDDAMFERDVGGGSHLGQVFNSNNSGAGVGDFQYQPEQQPTRGSRSGGVMAADEAAAASSSAASSGGNTNAVLHHDSVHLQR